MQLRTRVSPASLFAAAAVLSTVLAWHAQRELAGRPAAAPPPSAAPVVASEEPQQIQDSAAYREDGGEDHADEEPGPGAPGAILDHLELGWMPKGYVRSADHDTTMMLANVVESWAADDSNEPRIEYRKGVVFVRSAEDRGDDGPYPRSAAPQDTRVCGEASTWLRAALQKRLANEVVTCDRNVCSYSGSEYAPDGYLVFREIETDEETHWVLEAWVEIYRAGLSPDDAARNRADVVRALRHEQSTSCPGEPDGTY